jgi:hypothetical protein
MELNASQRRRMLAESRQKARWDEQARLEGAEERGEARGEKRGLEQGRRDVVSLLKSGKSPDEIIQLFDTAK